MSTLLAVLKVRLARRLNKNQDEKRAACNCVFSLHKVSSTNHTNDTLPTHSVKGFKRILTLHRYRGTIRRSSGQKQQKQSPDLQFIGKRERASRLRESHQGIRGRAHGKSERGIMSAYHRPATSCTQSPTNRRDRERRRKAAAHVYSKPMEEAKEESER